MAKHQRSRPCPPAEDDDSLKRTVITGIAQGVAREVVYFILFHW